MQDLCSFESINRFLLKKKEFIINEFHINRIGVFGSLVKNKDSLQSDIDILIEFKPDQETFKNYMGLKFFLEDSLERKVDLVISKDIKPLLREDILREVIYV